MERDGAGWTVCWSIGVCVGYRDNTRDHDITMVNASVSP